ncbi:MAG: aldo/keto reductase [Actinomycetaceae bacterium]|nr:aldo/keto reductase [Actinomycetaceae bacterium]
MQYHYLAHTGIQISHLGLGTLTWGQDTSLEQAQEMMGMYLEAGGNVIHTSPLFAGGQANQVIGEVLKQGAPREDLVIIAKGGFTTQQGQATARNTRTAILQSIETSLSDLETDYLDLFILHAHDPHTALEETLAALDLAQRSGKIRALGIGDFGPWEAAEIINYAKAQGIAIHALENEYSLLNRKVETHILPGLARSNGSFIATSPLARGVLSGKYRHGTPPDSRAASTLLAPFVAPYLQAQYLPTVEAVVHAGDGLGIPAHAVALAWLNAAPEVSCAIVGPRNDLQLRQILEHADLTLPLPLIEALSDASARPENFTGPQMPAQR